MYKHDSRDCNSIGEQLCFHNCLSTAFDIVNPVLSISFKCIHVCLSEINYIYNYSATLKLPYKPFHVRSRMTASF